MSNDHSMSPHDRDFGIAVGLWGAALVTVFGYGLYALIERQLSYAILFTGLGLAGLVYLTCHLKGRRLSPRAGVMAAMLAVTWLLIVYQIWQAPSPMGKGFTQAEVDQKVKAAVDPIQAQLIAGTGASEKKSLSPTEEQFRLELRKFVLSCLETANDGLMGVMNTMMNRQAGDGGASAPLRRFAQDALQLGLQASFSKVKHLAEADVEKINSDELQAALRAYLLAYRQYQEYVPLYAKASGQDSNVENVQDRWREADGRCRSLIADLNAYPLGSILKQRFVIN